MFVSDIGPLLLLLLEREERGAWISLLYSLHLLISSMCVDVVSSTAIQTMKAVLVLLALLPAIALATIGVDISQPTSQSAFGCLKSNGKLLTLS
jgi:hypothetical protein